METVLYQFLIEVPQAAAIWSALLVVALGVLTALVARPEATTPAEPTAGADEAAQEAADLRRYAGEVAVAAAGAARTARRRRDAWRAAQEDLDRAWRAYDRAETAARRLAGTTALPTPRTPHTPAEYAARERWLHHAAMAAHWRGDLSASQLSDVFGRRAGWDPRRHPAEQEVVLARAVRDHLSAAYRSAAERERAAWRAAEVAVDAARALTTEAYAAAVRLRPAPVPAVRVPGAQRRPVAAARWRPAGVG
ncbi:hypothetical protein GA0070616_4503 [Micromonospora nigra]|uniref:AP2/ERF domain-containing protein n=1 Tax=Micromonospora nigra TaxID=145857 RepID=A0A1C6SSW2_9ACTN|nr:hypothetical protein [Micromonospora nigra]SCL32590.1 hypothetical protein GA0070616_4503 [Micromonospora nigra]